MTESRQLQQEAKDLVDVEGVELSDAELVARCLEEDESAAAVLYRRHARRVAGMIHRLAGRDRVDDLVQETFAEAFSGLRSLRKPERFKSWLTIIALRKARRQVARMLKVPERREELVESLAGPGVSDEVVDVYHRLTTLPPKIYVAWMLRRVEGFTIAQTASLCRVGTTTVKRWVARGDRELAADAKGGSR